MTHDISSFSSFGSRKEQEKKFLHSIIKSLSGTAEVVDVSEDERYYKLDVDLILRNLSAQEITIEVKVDDWIGRTGNFFFEIISNEQKNTPGCFLSSHADIWFYLDTINRVIYILPLRKCRGVFFALRDKYLLNMKEIDRVFPLQSTHTRRSQGGYSHTTIGRKVAALQFLKILEEEGISYIKWDYLQQDIDFTRMRELL